MSRIVVISDLHFSDTPLAAGLRRGDLADVFLLRVVHRLNRYIRPDVVVFLGDVIDDGMAPGAHSLLIRLRGILNLLRMPWLILPGNHDGDVKTFYEIMPRPPEHADLAGVRFLPFFDIEEPGYNARRSELDLMRMRSARGSFTGPVVALQHVPLFPDGASDCLYRLVNSADAIAAMRCGGIDMAIGGHYHPGFTDVRQDGVDYLAVPALCEAPFAFHELIVGDGPVRVIRHELSSPPELGLVDWHVHTPFAYCNENMDPGRSVELARVFGLAGFALTEHSSHLYYEYKSILSGEYFRTGLAGAHPAEFRADAYFNTMAPFRSSSLKVGLETDVACDGSPTIRPVDAKRCEVRTGAIHELMELRKPHPDPERCRDEFLFLTRRILETGPQILAHPFRVFRLAHQSVPESLFAPVCRLLREHKVAAEINFHTNQPSPDFIRMCICEGVRIALGSDAHNLYEIGEFAPHLALLRSMGYDSDLNAMLIPFTGAVP